MLSPRIVLGSVALFAMVRFFISPTWPCAFVVAVALAVAVASETLRERTRSHDVDSAAREARQALEAARLIDEVVGKVADRVSRLESIRALGG